MLVWLIVAFVAQRCYDAATKVAGDESNVEAQSLLSGSPMYRLSRL